MVDMTETPLDTPCQTGKLCLVPKRRKELIELEDISDDLRHRLIAELESTCNHETHPDDWFEDPGAGYATASFWRSQRARARCFQCPIRTACLERGLEPEHIEFGIWGGLTAAMRGQIHAARVALEEKEAEDAPKEQESSDPVGSTDS